MNKIIIISLLGLISFLNAKLNIVVSILPQQTFVKAIGKDKVSVTVMVKPGNSPHTYEPKPSQMRAITKANIYFSIGVEFEKSWINKFANQNKNMIIKDISQGIKKQQNDPHIWTSPTNVKEIVKNIYIQLSTIDKKNKKFYKHNLDKFLKQINKVNNQIKSNLKCIPKNSKFMVFHPAWGYFAKEYDLIQISVEVEGKEPKPKALASLLKKAKLNNIKAIFTQPEFSPKMAKILAQELNIKVIKTSPINPNWSKNLIKFSEALCQY